MASCFHRALQLRKKNRDNAISLPPPSLPSFPSSSSTFPSLLPRKKTLSPGLEIMEKRRRDSLESWSMLFDPRNLESFDSNSGGQREEWMADHFQLFIGYKLALGAHGRIYRGIYKQRAVAVKMLRIPDQDEHTRRQLEEQFKS